MSTELSPELAAEIAAAELDLNGDAPIYGKLTAREKRDLQKSQLRPLANRRPELYEEDEFTSDEYERMLELYNGTLASIEEGEIVKAHVLEIRENLVVLDIGFKNQAGPMLDNGFSAFIEDMDQRGLLDETLVVALGEFGRTPERGLSTSGNVNSSDGRDHWPYCYTACVAGAGIKRGYIHGESDATGSSPKSDPVHPTELLALIYHACGIDPETIVYNHLNQPRELVKAKPVTALFA